MKTFGIEMTVYGVNNIPLRRETKWFESAEQLAEFYFQNTKKNKKKKKKDVNAETEKAILDKVFSQDEPEEVHV